LCCFLAVLSAFNAGLDATGNFVTGKNRVLTIQFCFSLHRVFSDASDTSLSVFVLPRKTGCNIASIEPFSYGSVEQLVVPLGEAVEPCDGGSTVILSV
jgi:hypothetical protein